MDKKWIYGLLTLVLALILTWPAAAQTPAEIDASLSIPETDDYTVGDSIEMTLMVNHPADIQVIFPSLAEEWGAILVHSQSAPISSENDDGSFTTSQIIDARLFAPGTYDTPPLSLTVAGGTGQLFEVSVPPASVTVNSVLVAGDDTLRDIKPQAQLPYFNLLPWGAAGLMVSAAAIIGFIYWRRRNKELGQAIIDNRPPYQVALDELARISDLALPHQGRFKEFYTEVSEAIRTYMGRNFQFPVIERTTAEIQSSLKNTPVSPEAAREFLSLLVESDLVKFSKFKPSTLDADQLLIQAYHIVELTKPVVPANEESSRNGRDGPGKSNIAVVQSDNSKLISNGKFKQSEVKA